MIKCCRKWACKGIENYSAVFSGPGSPTPPRCWTISQPDFCCLWTSPCDLPQLRAMYGGDYARKKTLVDFGFRLPSALDNRPSSLKRWKKLNQIVFVSATPLNTSAPTAPDRPAGDPAHGPAGPGDHCKAGGGPD